MNLDQINAISPVLTEGVRLSDDEINALNAFLGTFEDDGLANIDRIIPVSVPSGLPVRALATRTAGMKLP